MTFVSLPSKDRLSGDGNELRYCGVPLVRVDDMTGANPVTLTGTTAQFPFSVFVR